MLNSFSSFAGKRFFVGSVLVVGAIFFTLSGAARAATATVGCPGGSGTFSSITAALASLAGTPGPNTINVTGTCNESVFISDFRSLTIQAPSPGAATIVAMQDGDGFDVQRSRDIRFFQLVIRGASGSSTGGGIVVFDESQASIESCTVSGHVDVGVAADGNSAVGISNSLIQNNGDGVDVTTNSTGNIADSTIQNNVFEGVFVNDRSSVLFRRQNSIAGNGDTGIFVLDLSRAVFNQRVVGSTVQATTIENNVFAGMVVAAQSLVRMGGQHKVRTNGCNNNPSCSENIVGGIFLLRNSTFRGSGGLEISNNIGPGLAAEQGVDVGLNDTKFNNNSGDGLQIRRISIGDLLSGNTFSGNGGASVSCDSTSLVVGDLTGITNISCKQIERDKGKPRPGKFKEPKP
jgi:hypothetical protein